MCVCLKCPWTILRTLSFIYAYLLCRNPAAKGRIHKVVNFLSRARREIVCYRIVLKGKLRPHYQVDDALFDSIGPVVVEDLVIIWISPVNAVSVSAQP